MGEVPGLLGRVSDAEEGCFTDFEVAHLTETGIKVAFGAVLSAMQGRACVLDLEVQVECIFLLVLLGGRDFTPCRMIQREPGWRTAQDEIE